MLFGDMVVAVCICEVAESLLLHAAVPCFVKMTFLSCTYCPVVAFPLVLSRRVPVGYGSVAVN